MRQVSASRQPLDGVESLASQQCDRRESHAHSKEYHVGGMIMGSLLGGIKGRESLQANESVGVGRVIG